MHKAEEHRLAHVGMTRAKERLTLTCLSAERRRMGPGAWEETVLEPADFFTKLADRTDICQAVNLEWEAQLVV